MAFLVGALRHSHRLAGCPGRQLALLGKSAYQPSPCPHRLIRGAVTGIAISARMLLLLPPIWVVSEHARERMGETHLISGFVTISINPVPALFKSIRRLSPTSWLFAVSCPSASTNNEGTQRTCSTCSCWMPISRSRSTPYSPFVICMVPSRARASRIEFTANTLAVD